MKFYSNLSVLIFLDLTTALFARYSFLTDSTFFLVFAIFSLSIAGIFFMKILEFGTTAVINAIWIALGTILVTTVSYFLFDEVITPIQLLAMSIMIFGLILMEIRPITNDEKQS